MRLLFNPLRMKKEAYPFAVIFSLSSPLVAQLPPIDVEWSAIRPYLADYGHSVHIARDPMHNQYVWATMNLDLTMDEVANEFLPDGTDVTTMWPVTFSVGSLDGLVDLSVHDSVMHTIIRHTTLGGNPEQDTYWHLDGTIIQTDPDGYLHDLGHDLVVTGDAVYGCGTTDINYIPHAAVGRVVKQDLDGTPQWNVTWDDPNNDVTGFSSVAVIGDTVFCAAYPSIVFLDGNTGAFIDMLDFYPPGNTYDMPIVAHGSRIYWAVNTSSDLLYGYHDVTTGSGLNSNIPLTGAIGAPKVVMDDQDRLWIGTTVDNVGRWFRLDAEFTQLDSGTLYESIDGMSFVNGRISFTGVLSSAPPTVYVVTGTPQP